MIKGGHANENICKDFLIQKDHDLLVFKTERKQGATEIRGTGCRLASAIAFFLASGISLNQAVEKEDIISKVLCMENFVYKTNLDYLPNAFLISSSVGAFEPISSDALRIAWSASVAL